MSKSKQTKKTTRPSTSREGLQTIQTDELDAVSGGTLVTMDFEWNNTVDSAAAGDR